MIRSLPILLVLTAAAPAQLVRNGDFRVGANLEGWQAGAPAFAVVDDDGFRSPGSLRLTGPGAARVDGPAQTIAVTPNSEYVLAATFKTDGHTAVAVRVRRADGKDVVSASAGTVTVWTPVLVRFNSGNNEKLTVVCSGPDTAAPAAARAWVDDIALLTPDEVPAGQAVEGGFVARPPGENLARGCSYTLSPAPNYGYSTDPDDTVQLTDGTYSAGYFWVQKETVGWGHVSPAIIVIDLGKTQPIAGLSYNAAAGCAGVGWPSAILVSVSEDSKTWRSVGDLAMLAARHGLPAADRYSVYRYWTDALATRGRFLALSVFSPSGYVFCDEIEVYRGAAALLAQEPAGEIVTDLKARGDNLATRSGVFFRLSADLAAARNAVSNATLPAAGKAALLARLDAVAPELDNLPVPDAKGFRAVLPLNDLHARILAVHAALRRAQGFPEFFAWKKHRYAWLTPTEVPAAAPAEVAVEVAMLGNEFRADSFLLTNAGDAPAAVALRVDGVPGAPRPPWLGVAVVPWTDTSLHVPVAAALPDAEFAAGAFRFAIPAGLTQKVWLTVDSSTLAPGRHQGRILAETAGRTIALPFTVRVSTVRLARPRLSLGMWDYTDGNGAYGITARSLPSAIALMRSHFVDSPWGGPGLLPRPSAADFDPARQLRHALDFSAFDAWVKRWPDARQYLVFLNVAETSGFAGARAGTPDFNARVGAWAKALAAHLQALGLQPRQLGLLLVDEPQTDVGDEAIVAWARPIKAAVPDLVLFEDTAWERPDRAKVQEAVTVADILCPYLGRWHTGGKAAQDYYLERVAEGRKLWFYQASGPANLLDPSRYHRLQAWEAFRYGAVGMGFWAFCDSGGAASSWNEYTAKGVPCTPAFLDPAGVTDAVHWQAVREGIEDYEYFAMLRDAAGRTADAALRAEALALLAEAPAKVVGAWQPDVSWQRPSDPALADVYRLRALDLIEKLR